MDFLQIGVAILLCLLALVIPLLLTIFFHTERKVVEVPIGCPQEGPQVLRRNGQEGPTRTKGQISSRVITVPILGSGVVNNTIYTFGQPGQNGKLIRLRRNYRKRR